MLWGKAGTGEGVNGKGINPVCEVIDPAGVEQIPKQAGVEALRQQDARHVAALGEGGGGVTKAGQAREGLAVPRLSPASGMCLLPPIANALEAARSPSPRVLR